MRLLAAACIILTACASTRGSSGASAQSAPIGAGVSADNVAHYRGCPVFTAGDWYNKPILDSRLDPDSANFIRSMSSSGDTGGFVIYAVKPPAYRVNLAGSGTKRYAVKAVRWHQNEFPDPVPWDSQFFIEAQSDGHAIVLNTDHCRLTEFYQAAFKDGTLSAYSGWTWNLRAPLASPSGHQPSSTAAGLPIFSGLIKGEEIEDSAPIDHALNFAPPAGSISPTLYVAPATNNGGCSGCTGPQSWPMPYGAHLRLRADFQLSCGDACPQAQRIVRALKVYGAFISDTGSKKAGNQLYIATDAAGNNPWNEDDLANLQQIHITDMDLLPLGALEHND